MKAVTTFLAAVGVALLAGCPPKSEAPPSGTPAPKTTTPSAVSAPSDNPEAQKAAIAAADAWLKLVDAGKYDEGWSQAAEFFRKAVSKEDWAKQMRTFREPLGKLVSREVSSAQYATSLPGAPDGEYVVIQYATSYEKKKSAIETVTPMKDPDGTWRVSGYFIK